MRGQTIVLTGKTLKGKNRVREYGEAWEVVNETDDQLLIQPSDNKFHSLVLRWIKRNSDADFDWRLRKMMAVDWQGHEIHVGQSLTYGTNGSKQTVTAVTIREDKNEAGTDQIGIVTVRFPNGEIQPCSGAYSEEFSEWHNEHCYQIDGLEVGEEET